MFKLDDIIAKNKPVTFSLLDREWEVNLSTRTGLFITKWMDKNKDGFNLDAGSPKIKIDDFLELIRFLVKESDFVDSILDLTPKDIATVACYLLKKWSDIQNENVEVTNNAEKK